MDVKARFIQMFRLKHLLCAAYALTLIFCVCQIHYYQLLSSRLADKLKTTSTYWPYIKQCNLPDLDPFNVDVTPFYKDELPVNCARLFNKNSTLREAAFEIKDGHYLFQLNDVGYPCCLRSFARDEDEEIRFSKNCTEIVNNVTEIPRHIEYVEIRCDDGNITKYKDAFSIVHPKKPRENPAPEIRKEKLNVIVFGFDATSQQNFYRKMPKTRDYLLDLSATRLKYYNKVGYNTLPNLAALLSGKSTRELVDNCIRPQINESEPQMADCPFIWKRFASKGYLTSFMEDCSLWSIFNYRWPNAFPTQPTDYYYRPLSIYMDSFLENVQQEEANCHGPRFSFVSMINMAKMITEVAMGSSQSYFQFIWSSRQSHGKVNGLGWLDDHLLDTLEHFHSSSVLNSTAVFILGDHGYHFHGHPYAQTPSGQIEDKMPAAYVILPTWFEQKYHTAYQNLHKNSENKITPYDLHSTFLDLMDLTRLQESNLEIDAGRQRNLRGISLFGNIPNDRTCLEAGIPLQYCLLCYPKISLSIDLPLVQNAANFLIDTINANTRNHRNVCLRMSLKEVVNAWKWDPRDVFSTMCHNENAPTDLQGRKLNVSCDFMDPVEVVQVTVTTNPHGSIFDGEAMRLLNGKWALTESATRLDWYSSNSWCVQDKDVKPSCFCNKKVKIK